MWTSAVVYPPLFYTTELLTSDTLSTLEEWPVSYYSYPRAKLGKELVWVLPSESKEIISLLPVSSFICLKDLGWGGIIFSKLLNKVIEKYKWGK